MRHSITFEWYFAGIIVITQEELQQCDSATILCCKESSGSLHVVGYNVGCLHYKNVLLRSRAYSRARSCGRVVSTFVFVVLSGIFNPWLTFCVGSFYKARHAALFCGIEASISGTVCYCTRNRDGGTGYLVPEFFYRLLQQERIIPAHSIFL